MRPLRAIVPMLRHESPAELCIRLSDLRMNRRTDFTGIPSGVGRVMKRWWPAHSPTYASQTFLPLVTEMHRWSDRRKSVDVPLFPGYVFVQILNSPEARLQVLKTSGVVQFVGNRQGAVPIDDKEISDVRTVSQQRINCGPYPYLASGAASENPERRSCRHRGRSR